MKTIESELVELQGLVDNTGNLSHFETFNKKKNLLAELLDKVTQGALRLKVQSILIDFFFFDNLHWVPKAVVYLPKEEGGYGLIHLQSRTAAFRCQFAQRLLTGPVD